MNDLLKLLESMKGKKSSVFGQKTMKEYFKDHSRIQSPSSINTYFECPRKYFYKYIKKIPTKPNIYRIRGKIIHSVLEDFFSLDPSKLSNSSFVCEIKVVMLEDFKRKWLSFKNEFSKLDLSNEKLSMFYEDSKRMIANFLDYYLEKLNEMLKHYSLIKGFQLLVPKRELYLESKRFNVRGYIDALYEGEKTRIIDYKTSSTDELREEYKRQLAIYSLLYRESYGKLPDEVGIHFLLYSLKLIPVTPSLVKLGEKACEFVHSRTGSGNIQDYPKGDHPLCKWSSGECDYYDICNRV